MAFQCINFDNFGHLNLVTLVVLPIIRYRVYVINYCYSFMKKLCLKGAIGMHTIKSR